MNVNNYTLLVRNLYRHGRKTQTTYIHTYTRTYSTQYREKQDGDYVTKLHTYQL